MPGLIDSTHLYDRYQIVLHIRERLCGGIPKNPDLLESFVKAKTGYDDAKTKEQVGELKDAIAPTDPDAAVNEVVDASWNGFASDEKGLYIHARNVKAMFKECASLLRITVDKRGSKQILQHGFEVKGADHPARVYLGRTNPDGQEEGPIHVQTAQGPRTAIKRVDYVEDVMLSFEVWTLKKQNNSDAEKKRHIGEDDLKKMLALGQENGLGADRSQGSGKFDVIEFSAV